MLHVFACTMNVTKCIIGETHIRAHTRSIANGKTKQKEEEEEEQEEGEEEEEERMRSGKTS